MAYTIEDVINVINEELDEAYESAYCNDIVESVIDAYENGVITYEEADAYLELISEAKDEEYKVASKKIKDDYNKRKKLIKDDYKNSLTCYKDDKKRDKQWWSYDKDDEDYYKAMRRRINETKKSCMDDAKYRRKMEKKNLRDEYKKRKQDLIDESR